MYGNTRQARPFKDRNEAGIALGSALSAIGVENPVVLALPRGGVPVAVEVAGALGAELDVLVVRKVGAPGQPELGIGAVAEGGVRLIDRNAVRRLGVTRAGFHAAVAKAEAEVEERIARCRGDREPVDVRGRDVVLVDDGLATGGTAAAAVTALRQMDAAKVTLAVPVGAPESVDRLSDIADDVICLMLPDPLRAVGHWYDDFGQVADAEVLALLERSQAGETVRSVELEPVMIGIDSGRVLRGDLGCPATARGLVIFAHGSGSGRFSPRNRQVAETLQSVGLATLLVDLLTEDEEGDRRKVFDIHLLAARLAACTDWAGSRPDLASLPIGYFGASTGAGAALVAAAGRTDIAAVVSRGGRPDLAGAALDQVKAPVLMIVGGDDRDVLELNRLAQLRIAGTADLTVVPGASHLFEEPGTLDIVAAEAAAWFSRFLPVAALES